MASLPLILSAILVLLTASAMAENNVLLTGQTLGPDGQLSYGDSAFVMQEDCNLVLYNKGNYRFQSNTNGSGLNCFLSFTDNGRLIIRRSSGSTVWTTSNSLSQNGEYAAVLAPDGKIKIFGPKVWSTPASNRRVTKVPSLRNVPLVKNVLFSGQTLYSNGQLTTRDYSFVMRDDCNLALEEAGHGTIWETETKGKGEYCFLRLDHRGQIAVKDDTYWTVYASSSQDSKEGDYVLVLQANGQAIIYGPVAWSSDQHGVEDGEINMVAME